MAIRKTLIAIAVLAWGCSPQAYIHDSNPSHPAHPDAQAGMLPRPSTTLTIGDRPSPGGKHGMQHDIDSKGQTSHNAHRARGAKTGEGGGEETLYQCPMHPEVTARDPERRCPKCKMKINKPVKNDGSAPLHQGHGGHGQ